MHTLPSKILIDSTHVDLEWSKRMTKTPAKVVKRQDRMIVQISEVLVTTLDELKIVVTELFKSKKVYIVDNGKMFVRGKKLGSGGFSTIYTCADDPTSVIKVCGNLNQEIAAYKLMECHSGAYRYVPEFKGCMGDECLVIGRYKSDLTRVNKLAVDLRRIIADVIRCLRFIHSVGLVHCDIKPGNIFLDKKDNVVIGDFGLAKEYSMSYMRVPSSKNKRYGTMIYMSRDVHSRVQPTRRSDMETLGWVIIELFGGNLPWKNIRNVDVVGAMKNGITNDLDDFLHECFDSEPIPEIKPYLLHALTMKYNAEPDYDRMISLFYRPSSQG